MPTSASFASTWATRPSTSASSLAWSTGLPCSWSRSMAPSASPRGMLPACVVKMRAILCCIAGLLTPSGGGRAGERWCPGRAQTRLPPPSKRRLVDLPVGTHEPMLARERLAGEPVRHPVRHQDRREWSEIGRRHVADRMARFLIHHHALRPLHGLDQPFGVLDWALFLGLAGDHEIGHANLVGVALPGDGLAKAVELVLVSDAGHVHEPLLEGRRRLLEDGVAAVLVTHRHRREGADARLVRGEDGAEEGAKAGAGAPDALGIDLGPADEPVDQRLADRRPVLHGEVDDDHGRLVLARA